MLTWSTIQPIWNILGFPGGIGCIDCIAPSINEGDWVNRSVHSINVQMSLNSTFTYILHNTASASNYVYQLWISHICNAVLHHCQRWSEVAWVCAWRHEPGWPWPLGCWRPDSSAFAGSGSIQRGHVRFCTTLPQSEGSNALLPPYEMDALLTSPPFPKRTNVLFLLLKYDKGGHVTHH